jgi:predicted secreted protein
MGRKKAHTPQDIVAKLRQAEVLVGSGKTVADAERAIGVTEPTCYRWRTELGGLKLDQAKRLKELERANARLREAVSDLTLEKAILKEVRREGDEPRAAAGLRRASRA